MYNKVILIGNLGKEPEVRYTQNNDPIVSFSLATSDAWYDKKDDISKTITEWHKVVILNPKIANVAKQYLFKGSKIYLEGKIRTRSWIDQSDQKRSVIEIIVDYNGILKLLDSKGSINASSNNDNTEVNDDSNLTNTISSPVSEDIVNFDDIPF